MKLKIFSVITLIGALFVSPFTVAGTLQVDVAKYMLKKQQPITKQIELQYQLLGSEKHRPKIYVSNAGTMNADEYVVEKAFKKMKVPLSKTAKNIKSISSSAPMQLSQSCLYPHSPEAMIAMTPDTKLSAAEVATINSALDTFIPLYDGLLENIATFAEDSNLSIGDKDTFSPMNPVFMGLTKGDYVNARWDCTKTMSPAMPAKVSRFYAHTATLSKARTEAVPLTRESLKSMNLDQIELLERIYDFYNSHYDYYRSLTNYKGNDLLALIKEVKELKINDSNFEGLETTTAPESSEEEFSIDELDI